MSARTAEESLLIQLEQLRLATSVERYREALEGVAGLCGAALAAGDRERGLRILRQLLAAERRRGAAGRPAPPRSSARCAAIATRPVLQALIPLLGALGAEEQARPCARSSPWRRAPAIPVLLDALVAEEDPGRRREIAALLKALGAAALPEMLQRLGAAPPAAARTLLPLVAEFGIPRRCRRCSACSAATTRSCAATRCGRWWPSTPRRSAARCRGCSRTADEEIVQVAAAHLGAVGSPETVRGLLRVFEGKRFAGPPGGGDCGGRSSCSAGCAPPRPSRR